MTELTEKKYSLAQMIRAAKMAKKYKIRMIKGRKKSLRKLATMDVLKRRAIRSAIMNKKSQLAGGQKYNELSPSQKMMISNKIEKILPRIKKLAKKLIKVKRQQDVQRILNKGN
jgi:hypothetical protein